MSWKSINSFSNSMVGKLVRFKTNYPAPNLSNLSGINKIHPPQINIPAGAVGVVYVVRGATLFIGFARDFKAPPFNSGSPSYYAATIQLYLDGINKLEMDYRYLKKLI